MSLREAFETLVAGLANLPVWLGVLVGLSGLTWLIDHLGRVVVFIEGKLNSDSEEEVADDQPDIQV